MNKALHIFAFKVLQTKKAALIFLFFSTGFFSVLKAQTAVLNSMVTRVVIDSLASQINKYYVLKDAAVKMSGYLKLRYEQGYYNKIEDPYELADLINADMYATHHDEHFRVEYNPVLAAEVSGEIDDVPEMLAKKLEQDKACNFGFKKIELLTGNIGYLEISQFARLNKYSKAAATNALTLLANTRALIIDLRYGRGGSPEMVNYIAGYFFKNKTHLADIYIRNENITLPYYSTPDTVNKTLHSIPIYILTGNRTFSAAEGLAFSLQKLKRATLVGETTRGGAHTVAYKPLSNGFVCDIPFGKVTDPVSKTNWEGTGVIPDIKISAEKALEAAQGKILDEAMNAAKDTVSLARVLWQMKLVEAHNHPVLPDLNVLQNYTGNYGSTKILIKEGKFLMQKSGKLPFELQAVSNAIFRVQGSEFPLFVFGSNSKGDAVLITHNEDGRKEIIRKNK